jgi:dimethylglycine dehydrogenase
VCEAGAEYAIRDFGMYAMDSLRLEKCYRSWKQDITHEVTPFEAGLDRFVRLEKGDFIGRDALHAAKATGPRERLVPLIVEAEHTDAPPNASVFANGRRVGLVSSGGYGHRVQKSLALAYVEAGRAAPGTALEVEIFGAPVPASVATEPIYDPANQRLRA